MGGLEKLTTFQNGIFVSEYDTQLHWLIDQHELFRLIPRDKFTTSSGGWPVLEFTVLGVACAFAFNFVTHPEEKFVEIQQDNSGTKQQTFGDISEILLNNLGPPNLYATEDALCWDDGRIIVRNETAFGWHMFSVSYFRVQTGQKLVLGNGQTLALKRPHF